MDVNFGGMLFNLVSSLIITLTFNFLSHVLVYMVPLSPHPMHHQVVTRKMMQVLVDLEKPAFY